MPTWQEAYKKQQQGGTAGNVFAGVGGGSEGNIFTEIVQGIADDVGLSLRAIPHLAPALVGGWWDESISKDEQRLRRRAVADASMLLVGAGLGKVALALGRGAGIPVVRALMGTATRAGATVGAAENLVYDMIDQPGVNPGVSLAGGAIFGGSIGWAAGRLGKAFKGKGTIADKPLPASGQAPFRAGGLAPGDAASWEVFRGTVADPDDPLMHHLWESVPPDQKRRIEKYANETVVEGLLDEPVVAREIVDQIGEKASAAAGTPGSVVKKQEAAGFKRARKAYFDELKNHPGINGVANRDARLESLGTIVGRKVLSLNELTKDEVELVTRRLAAQRGVAPPVQPKGNAYRYMPHGRKEKPSLLEFPDEVHKQLYDMKDMTQVDQGVLTQLGETLGVPMEEVPGLAQVYRDINDWAIQKKPPGYHKLMNVQDAIEMAPEYAQDMMSKAETVITRSPKPPVVTKGRIMAEREVRKAAAAPIEGPPAAVPEVAGPPARLKEAPSAVRFPDGGAGVQYKGTVFTEGDIVRTPKGTGKLVEMTESGGRYVGKVIREDGLPVKAVIENMEMVQKGRRVAPTEQAIRQGSRKEQKAAVGKATGKVSAPPTVGRTLTLLLKQKRWEKMAGIGRVKVDELLKELEKANREGDPGMITRAIEKVLYYDVPVGHSPANVLGPEQARLRNQLGMELHKKLRAGYNFGERVIAETARPASRAAGSKRISFRVGKAPEGMRVPKTKAERQANKLLGRAGFFQKPGEGLPPNRVEDELRRALDDASRPNPTLAFPSEQAAKAVAERFVRKGMRARAEEIGGKWRVVEVAEQGVERAVTMRSKGEYKVGVQPPSGGERTLGVRRLDNGQVMLDNKANRHKDLLASTKRLGLEPAEVDKLFNEGRLEFGMMVEDTWYPLEGKVAKGFRKAEQEAVKSTGEVLTFNTFDEARAAAAAAQKAGKDAFVMGAGAQWRVRITGGK